MCKSLQNASETTTRTKIYNGEGDDRNRTEATRHGPPGLGVSLVGLPSLGRPVEFYWRRRAEGLNRTRGSSQRTLATGHWGAPLAVLSASRRLYLFLFFYYCPRRLKSTKHNKKTSHSPVPATFWGPRSAVSMIEYYMEPRRA